jgi:hypothetical protein
LREHPSRLREHYMRPPSSLACSAVFVPKIFAASTTITMRYARAPSLRDTPEALIQHLAYVHTGGQPEAHLSDHTKKEREKHTVRPFFSPRHAGFANTLLLARVRSTPRAACARQLARRPRANVRKAQATHQARTSHNSANFVSAADFQRQCMCMLDEQGIPRAAIEIEGECGRIPLALRQAGGYD